MDLQFVCTKAVVEEFDKSKENGNVGLLVGNVFCSFLKNSEY